MNKYSISGAAILYLIFSAQSVAAGDYVNTTPKKSPDYYVWISTLSQGKKIWTNLSDEESDRLGEKAIAARQFRVAVTTSEIYSSVYLEQITEGPEGCCRRFAGIRQLDLYDMQKKFRLRGELAGFEVVSWTSPTSLKFRIHDRTFELSGLEKERVYVEEIR